jgi:hypothetical protein
VVRVCMVLEVVVAAAVTVEVLKMQEERVGE